MGSAALKLWEADVARVVMETIDMCQEHSQRASDTGVSRDPAAPTDLIQNNCFANHNLQPVGWTRSYAASRVAGVLQKMVRRGQIKRLQFGRRDCAWERT